jgi:hypothetical protein
MEGWRRHYNAVRTHASLGYRPLALLAVLPATEHPICAATRQPNNGAEASRTLS